MKGKCNDGVCCDVCDCKHNERGCDCSLNKIRVSRGENDGHHFCKSYECKDSILTDINDTTNDFME